MRQYCTEYANLSLDRAVIIVFSAGEVFGKSRSVIKKISRARLTLSAARGIYEGQRSCSFELRDRAA